MNNTSVFPEALTSAKGNFSCLNEDNTRKKDVLVISVREILDGLLELQKLDSQISALRRPVDISPSLGTKEGELKRLGHREQEKTNSAENLRLSRNQTKRALEICRDRLMRTEADAKQIKDSSAFQKKIKEIDQLKKLEEDLELKERSIEKESEVIQNQISEIHNERLTLESSLLSATQTQRGTEKELDVKIAEIERLKAPITAKIPASYIALYKRLLATRGGVAIARIRGTSCGGCQMILPPQFLNQINRSPKIEECSACHRILVPLRLDTEGH